MRAEETLSGIVDLFEANLPSYITYQTYSSGTLDLTAQLDEFDASVKELLCIDEFAPESIATGKSQIAEVIKLARQSESTGRKELFLELLEILDEKLNELMIFQTPRD
jgi:hypothetical protein